jgi:hypothetical protein
MIIDLTNATLDTLVDAMFVEPESPATSPDSGAGTMVELRVDPGRQILLLAELFEQSAVLDGRFAAEQIERGLWRLLGAEYADDFTAHIWNPRLPFDHRAAVVAAVYDLYDALLARRPFEAIDFCRPDRLPRRFATIDYMVPDLLLGISWMDRESPTDREAIRNAFFQTFGRLLHHPAPVAQYAALHGLGHLRHPGVSESIDHYLASDPNIPLDRRTYAERARRGDVL